MVEPVQVAQGQQLPVAGRHHRHRHAVYPGHYLHHPHTPHVPTPGAAGEQAPLERLGPRRRREASLVPEYEAAAAEHELRQGRPRCRPGPARRRGTGHHPRGPRPDLPQGQAQSRGVRVGADPVVHGFPSDVGATPRFWWVDRSPTTLPELGSRGEGQGGVR